MGGQLLLRCRPSSSSSPTNFLSNLSTLYRAFSAASPPRIKLTTDYYSSKLGEAECSEHWEEFKSWMSKHQKCCRSHKEILYRFTIFSQRLNIQKLKNELCEAKCSKEWKVFKRWMSKYKKEYKSDKETLLRFNIFIESKKKIEAKNEDGLYYSCTGFNKFSDSTPVETLRRGRSPSIYEFPNAIGRLCSEEWKVFERWMSRCKKRYESDKEILYRFNLFSQRMYGFGKFYTNTVGGCSSLSHLAASTYEDPPAISEMSYSLLAEVLEGIQSEAMEWIRFGKWMWEHKKKYKSNEEMLHRYRIFKECLNNIEKANKENIIPGCMFDFNRFSDLTSEELPRGKSSFSKLPLKMVLFHEILPALPVKRWLPKKSKKKDE